MNAIPLRKLHISGFTLIEMSIVLVIIGLIVGSVLVGRDLIKAAEVRAEISQIEKYHAAVNTFRGKYAYLPGDIPDPTASQFGFATRGTLPGQGDGNGLIDGPNGLGDLTQGGGETGLFWNDLSTAHLVDGSFTSATATSAPDMITSDSVGLYMPPAKLGNGNFIYAYDDGAGNNWFGFSGVTTPAILGSQFLSTANITVLQASQIDAKVDDGFPASGNVQAVYLTVTDPPCESGHGPCMRVNNPVFSIIPAQSDSPAAAGNGDCFDSTTQSGAYAVTIDNGADVTCALSFKFQ